jgi:hypothetical protein
MLLLVLAICATAVLPGCAAGPTQGSNVNLSGFPPQFREGYADGCASARGPRKRDEARFKSGADPQYASGWRDGFDICSRR